MLWFKSTEKTKTKGVTTLPSSMDSCKFFSIYNSMSLDLSTCDSTTYIPLLWLGKRGKGRSTRGPEGKKPGHLRCPEDLPLGQREISVIRSRRLVQEGGHWTYDSRIKGGHAKVRDTQKGDSTGVDRSTETWPQHPRAGLVEGRRGFMFPLPPVPRALFDSTHWVRDH